MFGDTAKHSYPSDQRPAKTHLGWAPGDYSNKCRKCGDYFSGDKRASMCADCAYAQEPT